MRITATVCADTRTYRTVRYRVPVDETTLPLLGGNVVGLRRYPKRLFPALDDVRATLQSSLTDEYGSLSRNGQVIVSFNGA